MILEHHLLPVVHVHHLLRFHRALVVQGQWHGVAELVPGELHAGVVGTDEGPTVYRIIVVRGQVGTVHAVLTLVRSVHARRELAIPALDLVHFVVDVVVIVAKAVVAAKTGESTSLSLF